MVSLCLLKPESVSISSTGLLMRLHSSSDQRTNFLPLTSRSVIDYPWDEKPNAERKVLLLTVLASQTLDLFIFRLTLKCLAKFHGSLQEGQS
jgi:hypothetical protein